MFIHLKREQEIGRRAVNTEGGRNMTPSMNSEAWIYLSNPKGEFIWGEKFQKSHSAAGKLLHGRDQQLNYKE